MTSITVIPAQKDLEQPSAGSSSHNLRENFLALINVKNHSGFSAEEIAHIEDHTIVELLIIVSKYDMVSEKKFKQMAKSIKNKSGRAISHTRALEIVARVFGYAHWYEASKVSGGAIKMFENKRNRSTLNLRSLLGLESDALN
jgi:hypothetical protein